MTPALLVLALALALDATAPPSTFAELQRSVARAADGDALVLLDLLPGSRRAGSGAPATRVP